MNTPAPENVAPPGTVEAVPPGPSVLLCCSPLSEGRMHAIRKTLEARRSKVD